MGRHGLRTKWDAAPLHVREGVEAMLGARIASAVNVEGGFSPGPAAKCVLSDGRSVFLKGAGRELNPQSPSMHRREADVLRVIPARAPAPRPIATFDDGDWVVLVIEWIDGRTPAAPIGLDDVDRLLRLVERISRVDSGLPFEPCLTAHPDLSGHWQRLRDEPVDGLDEWSRRHLAALVQIESGVAEAVLGDHLVHLDLRTDNVVFAAAGETHDVVVDWPGAACGAPWVDLVALLPSLELDGGPTAEALFDQHPIGRAADPTAVTAFVAAIAGYFTRLALLDAPPGLPTVRAFQAAQGAIARRWLAERAGLPEPGR